MESELNSLLICKICNNIYKNPAILPCGNSICLNHVQNNYECKLCDQIHPMPQNGFRENAELNMLLQMRNSQILQGLCEKMNELAQRAELISNEPTFFINEYFSELRAMIDSERDKLIKKVNEDHSRILEQVNQNERECLSNNNYNQSVLNRAIRSSRDELTKWQNSNVNSFLSDTKCWHNLKCLREFEIVKLKHALNEFQKELLLYKKFSFETKPIKDENTFGVLNVLDDSKSNNDKLEEAINFEIKKFKSFVSDKLDRYYDKYLILNQIPWRILFKIEKNSEEDSNLFLCAYFMPEYDKELPHINKVNLTFKLIDLDGEIFTRIEYSYFGGNFPNRSVISSINDLMNSTSKVYNTEIDSINLEINIVVETIEIIIRDFLSGSEDEKLNATKSFQNFTKNQLILALKAGIVPKLVKLQENNNQLKFEAARVLTKITSSDLLKIEGMIEADDLALLVILLSSSCEDVQEEALWILRNITGDGCEHSDLLLDHGILSPLLEILSKDKLMLRRRVAWFMHNLFLNNVRPVDITIIELELLSDQLLCTDKQVLSNLCNAILFLTTRDDSFRNIQKILYSGIFPRLVGLLLFDSSDVVQVVLDIVTSIVNDINSDRQAILRSELLSNLCVLLSSPYEPIRITVIRIISKIIAQNPEPIQAAFDANIFSKMIEILNDSSNIIKKETVSVLRDTTIHGTEQQIRNLINLNIISSLCNLLTRENCNEIVELSLECLINMVIKVCCSDTREYKIRIENCNGLEKINSLMQINNFNENVFNKAFQLIQMYNQYLA